MAYQRRSYQPPCVQSQGYSVRVDTRDAIPFAAVWRIPQFVNALIKLGLFGMVLYLFMGMVSNFHKSFQIYHPVTYRERLDMIAELEAKCRIRTNFQAGQRCHSKALADTTLYIARRKREAMR